MEILTGIILGLSTLLFIGPVFFYLLQITVTRGTLSGVFVALGIILGDFLYVYFCLYGIHDYLNKPDLVSVIAITGGLLLLVLGLEHIFKKPKECTVQYTTTNKSLLVIFLKSFALNFINPFVFAVWVGFFTYSKTKYTIDTVPLVLGFALITILLTDILKVFLAKKLSHFFNFKNLLHFKKAVGIVLLIFAVRLFWTVF